MKSHLYRKNIDQVVLFFGKYYIPGNQRHLDFF